MPSWIEVNENTWTKFNELGNGQSVFAHEWQEVSPKLQSRQNEMENHREIGKNIS